MERMRGIATAVLVAAVLVLAVASSAAPSAATSLKITYWSTGEISQAGKTWTLRCEPARGTLARPAVACRKLAAGAGSCFAPVPRSAVCTEIYGGPDTARVVGVVDGATCVGDVQPHKRLPHRALEPVLPVASADVLATPYRDIG